MTFYGQGLDRLAGHFTHTHELGPKTQAFVLELADKILAALQGPSWEPPPMDPDRDARGDMEPE
jgi:hypothetical protein